MLRRGITVLLVVWILATIISPSYADNLPNTVLRAGKYAAPVAFAFLLTAGLLLLASSRVVAAFERERPKAIASARLLDLTCVRLC